MTWWRAHHGLPYDFKLGIIARMLQVRQTDVGMVWVACLDHASQAEDRGSVARLNPAVVAFGLGLTEAEVTTIVDAFRVQEMISGDRLTAWDRRQPEKDDPTAAERQRERRERKKMSRHVTLGHAASRSVTLSHASVTPVTEDVTPRHALSQNVTPRLDTDTDKKRLENPVLAFWEDFKRLYPSHRLDEERACQAMLSREDEAPAILAGLRAAVVSPDWTKDNGQYVPRASGFISDGRYEDFRAVAPKPVVYFDPRSITG